MCNRRRQSLKITHNGEEEMEARKNEMGKDLSQTFFSLTPNIIQQRICTILDVYNTKLYCSHLLAKSNGFPKMHFNERTTSLTTLIKEKKTILVHKWLVDFLKFDIVKNLFRLQNSVWTPISYRNLIKADGRASCPLITWLVVRRMPLVTTTVFQLIF